jgi:hypothetical protein
MKKNIFIIGSIVILTISALTFIYFSNDHKECSNSLKISSENNGKHIKEETHICNEKFNF